MFIDIVAQALTIIAIASIWGIVIGKFFVDLSNHKQPRD